MRTTRDNRFQPHTPLGSGGEFDIIRRMLERWGPRARRIGDDAAVLNSIGDRALVVSTDTSVENVHFKRDWLTPTEIGYRATTAALSDLAAMAAKPVGILVAMAVPENWRGSMDQLGDGIGDAAAAVDAPILGGDMSRASELSLTMTVLGVARTPLFRTGARTGDYVYVTGRLGGAQDALNALLKGDKPQQGARHKFARPAARIEESCWLAERGATAAIDISDGLAADIAHVAAASKAKIEIELESIPVFDAIPALEAINSGEEYEIVVTSAVEFDVPAFVERFSLPLTCIGRVVRGEPCAVFLKSGAQIDPGAGYLHFQ
jgi:thiamine-monophosphate kinase